MANNELTYSKFYDIKNIVRENPFLERIIFETGEIRLQAFNDRIYAQTLRYDDINNPIMVEHLFGGYDPRNALRNAEQSIINRIRSLESKKIEREINIGMKEYFQKMEVRKAQWLQDLQ